MPSSFKFGGTYEYPWENVIYVHNLYVNWITINLLNQQPPLIGFIENGKN